ncbi:MAG: HAMP domain-containing histidine kinase [Gemmatimonadetes bacterium]|nr:HAMP domain-containing histidine kinase [Gemmatimonadota bacterium]
MVQDLPGLELDNARDYRAARDAIEARDRVLAVVAHDLRSPLNAIVMGAVLIRDLPLSREERNSKVEMILSSAHRMNRLIQDLLDVARMEAGHLLLEREGHAPEAIVRDAVEFAAERASARSLRLDVETPDAPAPLIPVDRDRILRVLLNIIDNAIRFTPEGGSIAIRIDPQGEDVRFSVTDTGIGIPAADLPHLFEPFWQRQTGGGGAGIGLSIARGIVEAHGGEISVDSVPGCGSTFQFTIPIYP